MRAREFQILRARFEQRVRQAPVPAGPFGRIRRWWNVLNTSVAGLRGDRFIDVRELMRSTTLDDHVAKADSYFSGAGWDTGHARKPFADPLEAEQLTRAISVLLPHLDLFSGARVLDFGAGTCWSSMIWAYLGCTVIATDVSANALRFGEERLRADPVAKDLPVTFLRFDGRRFDLPDAAVDRIIGIDTLHHVLDVPATLTELARLLAPGGIAAFSEPGPFHSMGPQAQHEMAAYGVIENDIRVADIRAWALAAGFADMRVAWFSPQARLMTVDEFDKRAAGRISGGDARKIVRDVAADMANIRIFFLYAPGSRALDSRDRRGLAAEFGGNLRYDGSRLTGTLIAKNTGSATWLPSGADRGAVNVGVQLRGAAANPNFARLPLSVTRVEPGQSASVAIDLQITHTGRIAIDLVAEAVDWFANLGNPELIISR